MEKVILDPIVNGFYKRVDTVDLAGRGAHSFAGPFLNAGDNMFPADTIIVAKYKPMEGETNKGYWIAFQVFRGGNLEQIADCDYTQGRSFTAFKRAVQSALNPGSKESPPQAQVQLSPRARFNQKKAEQCGPNGAHCGDNGIIAEFDKILQKYGFKIVKNSPATRAPVRSTPARAPARPPARPGNRTPRKQPQPQFPEPPTDFGNGPDPEWF